MTDTQPTEIDIDRDEAITLTWPDGRVDAFTVADLRAACPCAACRGEREQGKLPGQGRDAVIADAELVGAWGLSLTWTDGHSTGIYPFDLLRKWADIARGEDGDDE